MCIEFPQFSNVHDYVFYGNIYNNPPPFYIIITYVSRQNKSNKTTFQALETSLVFVVCTF